MVDVYRDHTNPSLVPSVRTGRACLEEYPELVPSFVSMDLVVHDDSRDESNLKSSIATASDWVDTKWLDVEYELRSSIIVHHDILQSGHNQR